MMKRLRDGPREQFGFVSLAIAKDEAAIAADAFQLLGAAPAVQLNQMLDTIEPGHEARIAPFEWIDLKRMYLALAGKREADRIIAVGGADVDKPPDAPIRETPEQRGMQLLLITPHQPRNGMARISIRSRIAHALERAGLYDQAQPRFNQPRSGRHGRMFIPPVLRIAVAHRQERR